MNVSRETIEHIKIVEFIKQCTDLPVIHIVNEGKRSVMMGSILKRMGMWAGACDLFIPRANEEYHGLFLEVKVGSGKVSPAQAHFISEMLNENYFAVAVWGAEAGIEVINNFYWSSGDKWRAQFPRPH